MTSRALLTVLLVGLCSSCRDRSLQGLEGSLSIDPRELSFTPLYAGLQSETRTFFVTNTSKASAEVSWGALEAPFSLAAAPRVLEPGATRLTVAFTPQTAGLFAGALRVRAGDAELSLALLGRAKEVPGCPAPGACQSARFDLASGACVQSPLPEGTPCDPQSACILEATCQAGRCIGAERSCDDDDRCTVDVCNAVTGCESLPAPQCPGDGACMRGVCDPKTGCGLSPVLDGASCGPVQGCDAAQVCIAGDCVLRDPPDGYTCAEASPCQPEGRCAGSVCQRAPAVPLSLSFTFDALATGNADAGVAAQQLHDFVMEPSGAVTLSGFFQTPSKLRVNTPGALGASSSSRRCMLWNGRLVCADYPASPNGRVSGIELATGATAWTFDIQTARPDFVALTNSIFLARLAVQGSDRLAALYEAYPKTSNPQASTNCRSYFLVVMNANGELVTAQRVEDPVLAQCNHPHPYGFAADAQGNLFIAFSPTLSPAAPLLPGSPTMVASYNRDGVFRWKFTDFGLKGGELAIAKGLLYPENSAIAVLAATGAPAFALDAPFGRAVVTRERTIPAPVPQATSVRGYESGTSSPRWNHTLSPGERFWGEQVRLARWAVKGGSRTVALTFTEAGAEKRLHAIDTRDGSLAFSCPMVVSARTEPQLLEVANGSIAFMEGSDSCSKCDPPFAGSAAAFHTVNTPLLSVAEEPWVGTFGGAGHDHREEVLGAGPTQ